MVRKEGSSLNSSEINCSQNNDSSDEEGFIENSLNIGNNNPQAVKPNKSESQSPSPSTSNEVKSGRLRPKKNLPQIESNNSQSNKPRHSSTVQTILRDFELLDESDDGANEESPSITSDIDNSLIHASDSDSHQTTTTNTNNSVLVQHDDTNSQFGNYEIKNSCLVVPVENNESIISISSEDNSVSQHQNESVPLKNYSVPLESKPSDVRKESLNTSSGNFFLNKIKTEVDTASVNLLETETIINSTPKPNSLNDLKTTGKNIPTNTGEKKVVNSAKFPTTSFNDNNLLECRRSSRKKIMKYDVKDLFNLNKPKKIQIEARIDSLPSTVSTSAAYDKVKKVSKIELKDIIKKPIEKNIICVKSVDRGINNAIIKNIYNENEIESKIIRKPKESLNKSREESEIYALPNEQKDEFKKYKELFENKFRPNFQRKISAESSKSTDSLNNENQTVLSGMLKSPLLKIKFKHNLGNRQSLDSLRRLSANSTNSNEYSGNSGNSELTKFETNHDSSIIPTNECLSEISGAKESKVNTNSTEKVKVKRGRPPKAKNSSPLLKKEESNSNKKQNIVTINKNERSLEKNLDRFNEEQTLERNIHEFENDCFDGDKVSRNKFTNNKGTNMNIKENIQHISSDSPNSQNNITFEKVQGFKIFESKVRIKRQKSIQSSSESDENNSNFDVIDKNLTTKIKNHKNLKENSLIIDQNLLNNFESVEYFNRDNLVSKPALIIPKELISDSFAQTKLLEENSLNTIGKVFLNIAENSNIISNKNNKDITHQTTNDKILLSIDQKVKKLQDDKIEYKINREQNDYSKSNDSSKKLDNKNFHVARDELILKSFKIENPSNKSVKEIMLESSEKSKDIKLSNIDRKQKNQTDSKKNYEKIEKNHKSNDRNLKLKEKIETENSKMEKQFEKVESKSKNKNKYDTDKTPKTNVVEKTTKNSEKQIEPSYKNPEKLCKDDNNKLLPKPSDKFNKNPKENASIKNLKEKKVLDFEKDLQAIEKISVQKVRSRDKKRSLKKYKEVNNRLSTENIDVSKKLSEQIDENLLNESKIFQRDEESKICISVESFDKCDSRIDEIEVKKPLEIENEVNLIPELNVCTTGNESNIEIVKSSFNEKPVLELEHFNVEPTILENNNPNKFDAQQNENKFEELSENKKFISIEIEATRANSEFMESKRERKSNNIDDMINEVSNQTKTNESNKEEHMNSTNDEKPIETVLDSPPEDPLKDIEKFIEAAGNLLSRSHEIPDQKDSVDLGTDISPSNLVYSGSMDNSDNVNNFTSKFKDSSNEIFDKSSIKIEIPNQISSPNISNTEEMSTNRKFGPRTPPFPPPPDDSFDFSSPKPEINLTSLSKKNEKNLKKSLRKLKKNENISIELKQTIKELKKLNKKSKNGAFNFTEDSVNNIANSSNEDSNSMKENKLSADYDDGRRRSHRIKTILKTNYSSVGRGLVRDRERLVGNDSVECGPYPDLSEIEAQNAKFLKDMEERLCQFKVIKDNEYKCERVISKEAKKMVCDCFLTRDEEERGEYGCGEDCLNRLLMIECGPKCTVSDRCTNRRFQRGQYAPCKVFRTDKKGFGIMADAEIQSGEFIMEYVGEVLNSEQFRKRAELYSKDKNKHHYFMALRSDAIIDATSRGNISRFINHSCEPNAQTEKWTVNGELRIGFFTTKNVLPGEEITFDYKFQRYGKEAQKCFCEAPTCRGWIGEEPNSEDEMKEDDDTEFENDNQDQKDKDESNEDGIKTYDDILNEKKGDQLDTKDNSLKDIVKPERKRRLKKQYKKDVGKLDFLEDPDLDEEVTRLRQSGLKNQAHTLKLSRLLVRAKLQETRLNLLEILRNGELPCLRLFLDYHGLKLLYGWMNDTEEKEGLLNMRLNILQTLEILPIISKTVLKDTKVYQTVENWNECTRTPLEASDCSDNTLLESNHNTIEIEIKNLSEKLLKLWDQLPEIFRIPRKERVEQMKEHEREADRQYTALKLFDDEQNDIHQRNRDRFQRTKYSNNTSIQIQSSSGNKFKWSRDNPLKTDPRLDQSRLSKIERRQLFAAKVAQNEAHKRMADEKRAFEVKSKYYWLNPHNIHPRDIPFCVNTNTGQWYTRDKRKIPTPPSHVHLLPKPKNVSKNVSDYKLPPMELPPLWKFAIDPTKGGRIYYYHVKIRIPQWEPPIKILPLSGDRNDLQNQVKAPNGANEESSEAYTDSEVEDQEESIMAKKKVKRYKLLVQERPISPRRDEDRIYNQIEMRRYKENKEKIRKRKEEIKRRKAQFRDHLGINETGTISSESPNLNQDKLDVNALPIADYLISSDEDDTISSELNTKLLEKIVQGEKCVDELDALQIKKVLKRQLINVKERISNNSSPNQELKKRKLEEKISKTKSNDEDIIKKSKSISSKQNSKYIAKKSKKNQNRNSWYNKEKFTKEIAGIIEQHLTPYRKESCRVGRITSDGDFDHLTRKLTHFVMLKELKHCDATGQILVVTDSVKNKSREFIKKYMTKYGEIYKRPENDPEFKEIPR